MQLVRLILLLLQLTYTIRRIQQKINGKFSTKDVCERKSRASMLTCVTSKRYVNENKTTKNDADPPPIYFPLNQRKSDTIVLSSQTTTFTRDERNRLRCIENKCHRSFGHSIIIVIVFESQIHSIQAGPKPRQVLFDGNNERKI